MNLKPTALKLLAGPIKPSRANPAEPQVTALQIPPAPSHLTPDEALVWADLARVTDPLRIVAAGDMAAFTILVQAVALAYTSNRNPKASINQRIAANRAALGALGTFGLTPNARQQVSQLANPQSKEDPLAEFEV